MTESRTRYASYVKSLNGVLERETPTQLVYSVSGRSFCWMSKSIDMIQIYPSLGMQTSPTRILRRETEWVSCVNLRTGAVDARYVDEKALLTNSWSYPGFRTSQCTRDYGFSLILQSYNQALQNAPAQRIQVASVVEKNSGMKPTEEKLVSLYNRLRKEHPHDLLPLESELPHEVAYQQRDRYRVIMVMTFSESSRDFDLTRSMQRFFALYPDFESLKGIREGDVPEVLKLCGVGLNKTGNNRSRFLSLLRRQPWVSPLRIDDVGRLGNGFGPKFQRVIRAYAFGDRNSFPLDRPAFRALKDYGFYKNMHEVQRDFDKVRADIEGQLRGNDRVALIDLHELLRFRFQAGLVSNRDLTPDQRKIILGWNGWRVLCSRNMNLARSDWIRRHLIKDSQLTSEFQAYFADVS